MNEKIINIYFISLILTLHPLDHQCELMLLYKAIGRLQRKRRRHIYLLKCYNDGVMLQVAASRGISIMTVSWVNDVWEKAKHRLVPQDLWFIYTMARAGRMPCSSWAGCMLMRFASVIRMEQAKPRALVYDILPSAAAIIDYAIGHGKLSANGQFFAGAQITVSL